MGLVDIGSLSLQLCTPLLLSQLSQLLSTILTSTYSMSCNPILEACHSPPLHKTIPVWSPLNCQIHWWVHICPLVIRHCWPRLSFSCFHDTTLGLPLPITTFLPSFACACSCFPRKLPNAVHTSWALFLTHEKEIKLPLSFIGLLNLNPVQTFAFESTHWPPSRLCFLHGCPTSTSPSFL